MKRIKSHYLLKNIFSYIPEIRELELVKYNKKLKQLLNINKYIYQKLFIQNYFTVDLSKFKITNLIKFFKSNFNNFDGKDDEKNLKKIISEIPWFNDYKKVKLITKNENNYKKCLNKKQFDKLELDNNQILSNLRILSIRTDGSGSFINDGSEIFIKDIFPHLFKLKIKTMQETIIVSYNLPKRIQILSLFDSLIVIDTKYKEIELLSLKSLKIVGGESFYDVYNQPKFLCPNLEYLFINGPELNEIFSHQFGENYSYAIPLIFSKLRYCNIIYGINPTVGKGLAEDYYKEITIRKYDKYTFKRTQEYFHNKQELEEVLEPFDEPYEPHEIIQNKKDLYINKFYCSKKDKLKNNFSENYEEIYEEAKGYKNSFFDLLSQKDNLKYLQLIGIFINKDNLNKINSLIENLKNFLFLKGFCLVVEDESIINKKDILDIIDNLSKLNLI